MSIHPPTGEKEAGFLSRLEQPTGRRSFLKWSGASLAVAAVGCSDQRLVGPGNEIAQTSGLQQNNFGEGDEGVLNYAYALEQLEAAFFTLVIARSSGVLQPRERMVLNDLRKHELIHREFYRTAIPALGFTPIPILQFDFELGGAGVNFNSRESVLTFSSIFEDVGVSAYNGAAQLIENPAILGVAGKIVSNEARHASAARDLLDRGGFVAGNTRRQFFAGRMMSATVTEPTTFGPAVMNLQGFGQPDPANGVLGGPLDGNGLDLVRSPEEVLPLIAPFIVGFESLNTRGLRARGSTG